ncbi:MAG: hypothetical protein AAF806_26950 [Bacteroidota bacterium]
MEKRTCLECGEELVGRKDKKFCDSDCRTAYNNQLNKDVNNTMRNINNILRKNRRILVELNPSGKARVHRDKMLERGFQFNYFTNIYRTKAGKVYRFCYDYGYLNLENDYFTLVKRQEYVE